MKKLDLRLLRMIKNSKGQFIAVTSLMVVGLMIYTALSMAAVNLEDTVNYYYNETNFADMFVKVVKVPEAGLNRLLDIPEITSVEGRVVFDVPYKAEEDERVKVRVVSIPNHQEINQLYKVRGDWFSNKSKDVLVIEQFAVARGIKLNDVIRPQIEGKVHHLRVKGIVASPEYVYLMENEQSLLPMPDKFGVLFVSEAFAQKNLGFNESYNEVVIKIAEGANLEKVKKGVEEVLDPYGVKRIITSEEQLSNRMISEEIDGVKKSSSAVPLIFLGVAAVIIAAMLSRMITNDRMSIGVLKALGYKDRKILLHYTKYALAIGLIGSVLGILSGTFLSGSLAKIYTQFFNIPMLKFKFYYKFFFIAILLSVLFCIAAGLWGARKVLHIVPAESMRPEPPKTGGRVFLDRIHMIWHHLSFSWKMVLRNILRNKKRFIFITLGIAMTFAITLMPAVQKEGVTDIFVDHYENFQKMDYNVNFTRPMNASVLNDVKQSVEVDHIEPKIEYPFELVKGTRRKVVNIIGVPQHTAFYGFKNLEKRYMHLPKDGMVLSEGLADYLHVKKGDKIKVKTYMPNKEDVLIEIKGIIKQSLGLNAYMAIEAMRQDLTEKGLVTGVYFNSEDDVKERLEDAKYISSIQSTQDMMDTFTEFMDLMLYSVTVMLFFGGVLGFVIVYNSTVMSISERRLEFSSLRVMGFSKREIFKMITKENIIMTMTGIIIGIPLGHSMVKSLEKAFSTEIYRIEVDLSLGSYLSTIVATIVFVFLAQLATYRKINKLDFMEALKNRIS